MSELTVEEIVADFEKDYESGFLCGHNIGKIIASWRERGEALKEARRYVNVPGHWTNQRDLLAKIDAALNPRASIRRDWPPPDPGNGCNICWDPNCQDPNGQH